jgi:mitochondrial fission protein ELM1
VADPHSKPLVWCLLGAKAGDNTQVLALAEELGWGYQSRKIVARPWELLVHLGDSRTLAGIDTHASDSLQAPWPDLVISAGRRNEPVARWIASQPGARTRLVHMGRPWSPLDEWDLIVTTPQYFLPQQPNILHNELPLHKLERAALAGDGERLLSRLQGLAGPYTVLLVGGDSGRFVFTADKGRRLGRAVNAMVAQSGGSLLLSNSSRTPAAAFDALLEQLQVPIFSHRWSAGAADNPYRGLLALGDRFVVTGESMSMLAEAAAMGRPLYIFDPGDGDSPWWRLSHNYRYKPLSFHLAMALGPRRMRRDVGRIQQAMVDSGHAAWLDDSDSPGSKGSMLEGLSPGGSAAGSELAATAARVRGLLHG